MKFKITKGKMKAAIRLVAYGAEGIGKSTFASRFPEPLFIDIEGGTKQLDVSRLPSPQSWGELLEEVDAVIAEPEVCSTLVIDTIDRAESLLVTRLCEESGCTSIESYGGGYGKGYTALQERFTKDFLMRLDRVIAKGVNVVLLAHAMMRKLESPDNPPYDRWELKVSKKVAPAVKEWADILLFMNYDVTVIKEGNQMQAKGAGKRMMHANHMPTYDAKNRYGLPDDMPLSFLPLKEIYAGEVPVQKEKTAFNLDAPVDGIVEGDEPLEDVRDVLIRRLEQKGISKLKLEAWLVSTGRIAPGTHVESLSAASANSMIQNIEMLVNAIGGKKND